MLIHGLIHFMGFAKAFGYGNITQIAKSIPKPHGFLWMLAAFLFIVSTILYLLKKDSWAVLAILSVVLSQFLIITVWQSAKFGTIANLVILAVGLIAYRIGKFEKHFLSDVASGINNRVTVSLLTTQDIEHLPAPVKKYILYSGSVGKQKVNNFYIEFSGQLRKNVKSPWMPFFPGSTIS